MKPFSLVVSSVLSLGLMHAVVAQAAPATAPLTRAGFIPLPAIEGRIDHFASDPATGTLYMSALENHTVEAIDLRNRRVAHEIKGINEPQGIAFDPVKGRIFIAGRGDGTLRTFDTRTYAEGPWIDLGRNADNVRLPAGSPYIYVGSGGEPGLGQLTAIKLTSLLPAALGGTPSPPDSPADLRLDQPRQALPAAQAPISAHPESFQIDTAKHRIYVNAPDSKEIEVLDSTTGRLRVIAHWPVTVANRNFSMALDAAGSRLFIACRKPATVVAIDTKTGRMIAKAPCIGDVDDMYYDQANDRLYLIGGKGRVDVFDASKPGVFKSTEQLATAPGARTGCFVPSLHVLAVAIPHTPGHEAGLLLCKVAS